MPSQCCVSGCRQLGYRDAAGNKVSFYRFPNDENRRALWIKAVNLRNENVPLEIKKTTFVCSKHFLSSDFLSNVANGYRRLKETAVPCCAVEALSVPAAVATCEVGDSSGNCVPAPVATSEDNNNSGICSSASNPDAIAAQGCSHVSSSPLEDPEPMETQEPQSDTCSCNRGTIVQLLTRQLAEKDEEVRILKSQLRHANERAKEILQEKQKVEFQLMQLEKEHDHCTKAMDVHSLCISDERTQFYTGLPDLEIFDALHDYLDPGENGSNIARQKKPGNTPPQAGCGRMRKLSTKNELFLVLVRLRLGLFEQDLADRFGVSQSTVSRICISWLNFMYLKLLKLPLWQPRSVVNTTMPTAFKEKYATTRVILDATEVRCEVASSLALQSSTYSTYKSANTFKGLVGIAPNGLVTFVSELFTGCTSDRECVIRSGFLELPFEEGDSVMADKGFTIADLLEKKKVHLNIPPFLRNEEFTAAQVQETKQIASLRIHIERRIRRVKSFHIFDRVVPLSLGPVANQMWTVAVILTNFQSPLVDDSN
ncbi:uncharacterized protein LOC135393955 [Ornithodoros turicata]|uniref:uncharacterized protein LOC135393955 n=1 Tax=Ornithodoros turicata TaxID=34597 RepID=UPI003138E37D